eukprot:COSAG05_NODE_2354_length_3191_cov_2.052584_1_plen_72_part_10
MFQVALVGRAPRDLREVLSFDSCAGGLVTHSEDPSSGGDYHATMLSAGGGGAGGVVWLDWQGVKPEVAVQGF